jgi:hypothetical protein
MSGAQAVRYVDGNEHSQTPDEERLARLREALMERLLRRMEEVNGRLERFLKNPGRLGAVQLSVVLSESALSYEVWREPSADSERRAHLAQSLGLSPSVDDASLLRALIAQVHQAFVEFQARPAFVTVRRLYEELILACEVVDVLPILPAHDTGPMPAELERVGLPVEKEFTRSLLVDARILSVALTPEDCPASPLRAAGQSLTQLGAIVAHVRGLNPRLTNRQVRKLLLRASPQEGSSPQRKSRGPAEIDRVRGFTRQLLRFQVAELLCA